MKYLPLSCLALCVCISTPAALGRGGGGGGMGSHHSSMGGLPTTGGAFGTNPATPGTNSLGTALSSNAAGNGPQKGPLLGTSPVIDKEDAKVDRMIRSVCRGC